MRKDWAEVILLLRKEIRSQLIDGHLIFKDPPCLVYGLDIEYTVGDKECFVYFMSEKLIDRIKNDPDYGKKFARHYVSLLIEYLKKKRVDPWRFVKKG